MNIPHIWMDDLGTTISDDDYKTLDDNLKDGLFPLFTEGSIVRSFEEGRQLGMHQERAMWNLADSTQEIENKTIYDLVTRVEVIDENGRSYTSYNITVDYLSLQDDNRTLKVFLSQRKKQDEQAD